MKTKMSKVDTRKLKADLANLVQKNIVFTYDYSRKMDHLPKEIWNIYEKKKFIFFSSDILKRKIAL